MTPERWRRVEEIFQAALSRGESERVAFLAHTCAGDLALRREVEALLAQQASAGGFLERPVVAAAGQVVSGTGAAMLTGQRLGAYHVHERIGVGGMGEVYRARDMKLGRDVAMKILPKHFTSDPDRLARFEREARVLASLNHPHIGAIYGLEDADGVRALVLELVSGETLQDRIAHGPIPIADTLTIARQIADALDAAHDRGIVHRDLKPVNIKITPDGKVKVLDFGLAKAAAGDGAESNRTQAPTITIGSTGSGMILGTPAYMSPEQARGQVVDKRTDIWAFGCVLYEMVTGRSAFARNTVSETLAAVLEHAPDWSILSATTAPSIRRLLQRCLDKDCTRRLHDIADARLELDDVLTDLVRAPDARGRDATLAVPTPGHTRRQNVWISALVLLALSGAVAFTVAYLRPSVVADDATQFVVLPPDGAAFGEGVTDRVPSFAISPDGRRLVFLATDPSGRRTLWVRPVKSLTAEPLAGTEGASFPFWSPDGAFVAFFAQGKLKKVALAGGAPLTLADAQAGVGGTWNRAGVIVFAADGRGGPLFRVPDAGGVAAPVTALDAERQERAHVLPQFLPDGRHFIYLIRARQPHGGVYVASLESRETKRLLSTAQKGMYAAPGYLLFLRDGTLLAQPFDPTARETSGEPVPIVESVAFSSTNGRAAYSISENGVLAYRASGIPGTSQLFWTDRSGRRLTAVGAAGDYEFFRLSPDESILAAELHDLRTGTGDLWLLDLKRGSTSRFTFDGSHNNDAVWSPDGTQVVFAARPDGVPNLHLKPVASGSETDEPLLPWGPDRFPTDWSLDGRHILFEENHPKTRTDLWILQMPDRKPLSYLQTEFVERSGRFSPDGQWVAYVSNETGRDEVFVRPFPAPSRKWQVSIDGGVAPQWRRDGKELFYVSANGTFKSVTIRTTPQFDPGPQRVLFTARIRNEYYSVSHDGQRVLLNPVALDSTAPAPPITLVINWASALKK